MEWSEVNRREEKRLEREGSEREQVEWREEIVERVRRRWSEMMGE